MNHLPKTILFIVLFAGLALSVFPATAKIQGVECGTGNLDLNCKKDEDVGSVVKYITKIINIALGLVSLVAVIFIIYAGVILIISQGDEKKAADAKHTILYAILGLLVIGIAAVAVNFTVNTISGGSSGSP